MSLAEAGPPVLALDVGGTKLAAGVVSTEGELLTSRRVPTPVTTDPEVLWAAVVALLEQVTYDHGACPTYPRLRRLRGLGVGCGGPMRWPEGEVSPLNIAAWSGFPLRRRLVERFGLAVRLHNDAVCVAAAEHWRGAARGYANVLGMVVSTGVGGGLVLDGRLVSGASGNAGHVGHVVVDPVGPECGCGGRGCLEAIASGPRLVAWARERGWRADAREGRRAFRVGVAPVASAAEAMTAPELTAQELTAQELTAQELTAQELTADARAGDPVALEAVRRAGRALGVALASVAAVCDLELVAVGGGLAQSWDLLGPHVHDALRVHAALDFTRELRVVPATLGVDVGLVGAAALHLPGDPYWPAPP